MYLGVVLNPLACKNRANTSDRCARLRHIVGPWGEVHGSGSLDDLGEIVAGLLPRASHLVSGGGDGKLHWSPSESWVMYRACSSLWRPQVRACITIKSSIN
jgi:hypothetical protein